MDAKSCQKYATCDRKIENNKMYRYDKKKGIMVGSMLGNKRKSSCLLLGIIIIIALTAGAYYYNHNVNENIKTTLYAVLEYPNEELFVDIPTYIPLNETQIDFEEKEIDEAVSEGYNRWKNKLEKCFSEDCFDSFYNQWERSMCNGLVYSDNYSSQITNIKLSQRIKDVQYLVVDLDVKNASGCIFRLIGAMIPL